MIDYIEYLDSTGGMKKSKTVDSRDGCIHLCYFLLAKNHTQKITNIDISILDHHLNMNVNDDGIYMPNPVYNNIICTILGRSIFSLNCEPKYKTFKLLQATGIYKINNLIFYEYLKKTFGLEFWFNGHSGIFERYIWNTLTLIPCLQMIYSCCKKDKLNIPLYKRSLYKLIGKSYEKKKIININKTITILSLSLVGDCNRLFYYTKKICNYLLKKEYGTKYMYVMMYEYFEDKEHPVIKEWSLIDHEALGQKGYFSNEKF